MAIDFNDIDDAVMFSSSDGNLSSAILDTESGNIYYISDLFDVEEELPEDIYENEKYIEIPNQKELGLGKPCAIAFVSEFLPDEIDRAYSIFSKRGAFSRFKDFIESKDLLSKWYDYQEKKRVEALKEWCEDNNIKLKS